MPHSAAHTNKITCAEARGQLVMMLCNCTEERHAGFEPDTLARMYRVRAAEIGKMLKAERERRAEYARRVRGMGHAA